MSTADEMQAVDAVSPGELVFPSHFCRAGEDPYDRLEWKRVDVEIRDTVTGAVVFSQRDVEVPLGWSDRASRVVASKFFHGDARRGDDPGAGGRETSVRQLVGRVCGAIADWGLRDGYFATQENADRFYRELVALCLGQFAAFSSPVWFNVGLAYAYGLKGSASNWVWNHDQAIPCVDAYRNPQASACQPYYSLVNTTKGMIPIGRIAQEEMIGLRVYDGPDSTTKVVAVKSNGRKPIFRIRLNDGFEVDATADHLVCAHRSRRASKPEWVAVADLVPGMLMRVHPGGQPVPDHPGCADIKVSEAALAGWLQTDGFVGQYTGTNGSLTVEFVTVNAEELAWVTRHLDIVFPDVHRHLTKVPVENPNLDFTRVRLYGEVLRDFVLRYDLLRRNPDMEIPWPIMAGTDEVVVAYLRSVFQADGYVSTKTDADGEPNACNVAMSKCSRRMMKEVQNLLARLGIYGRMSCKKESRADRYDQWVVSVSFLSEREKFAAKVGFLGNDKQAKLQASLDLDGKSCPPVRYQTIVSVEPLGSYDVYDIQTESGCYLSEFVLVHNCFIQKVDDNMADIMRLATSEAMLFKYGSGTGTDLSTLRSTRESLTGGGRPSGPVSFMRIYDSIAGVIKSGGVTRRAAKMQTLKCHHPDILDFIDAKAKEDAKARALIASGAAPGTMNGTPDEAYSSVFFQNCNMSVRATDAFLMAAEAGDEWVTREVTTGRPSVVHRAADLLRAIAENTWKCGDPGMQYDDSINRWHTCPNSGRINSSNPCSEFLFLDDSACNLASINLAKFVRSDGRFDEVGFRRAVRLLIVAQDILVDRASYPTAAIAENSHRFRPLGLGYANLGALLMGWGIPYDSDEGRSLAASVTSLMHGQAYLTSAEVAGVLGPFDGLAANVDEMMGVIEMHMERARSLAIGSCDGEAKRLASIGAHLHERAYDVGGRDGYRNSQVTLLAPTGTIAFMMDCDTTGIEPAPALVIYKTLSGGGTIRIANRTVPEALEALGYGKADPLDRFVNPPRPRTGASAILSHIEETGSIEGAPGLKAEHLPVFDCALASVAGGRFIAPMGHVGMMAAVQPFLSGAISKTCNVPEETTPESILELYLAGWRLGLKALAIYRDNSKGAQPLTTKEPGSAVPAPGPFPARPGSTLVAPVRERLPETRQSVTHHFEIEGHDGYVTVGKYPDGRPGEVFIVMAKEGSTIGGLMDSLGTSVSIGLQYGVSLESYVRKLAYSRFEPWGYTPNPDIPIAKSIADYVFRWLGMEFIPGYRADHAPHRDMPSSALDELARLESRNGRPAISAASQNPAGAAVPIGAVELSNPLCRTCHGFTVRAGTCYTCTNCGEPTGCS
jgi:ribonucleoside-diphosphate reductase alpha chain